MKLVKWPISSVAGVAVIVLYCVFTFTSLALYPTAYSPVTNWLSDLGNSSYNPRGSVFYNLGCILTGIALFPFFIGFHKWYTNEKWRRIALTVTQVIGCAAAFSLIMIGVFSEDCGWLHTLWSSVFFVLNSVVLILAGLSLITHPRINRFIAYYGFIVAAINLVFILLFVAPLFEWITVFTALGYVGMLTYNTSSLDGRHTTTN